MSITAACCSCSFSSSSLCLLVDSKPTIKMQTATYGVIVWKWCAYYYLIKYSQVSVSCIVYHVSCFISLIRSLFVCSDAGHDHCTWHTRYTSFGTVRLQPCSKRIETFKCFSLPIKAILSVLPWRQILYFVKCACLVLVWEHRHFITVHVDFNIVFYALFFFSE